MGVAVVNALVIAVTATAHSFSDHTGFWMVACFFLGKHMPAKIPLTPQQFWTWGRDAIQSYIATKEPAPQNPTQPVQTAPETNH